MGTRVGDYQITAELARSAAVATYVGEHAVLPRVAVVKTALARSASVRLLREACILEALRHPGIPAVYEAGVLANGRPWCAIERVDGDDLARLRDIEPLQVAAIVREVAALLDHAHRRGIVHAGLRPDRIVLTDGTRGATVFVVDWSEARTHDATAAIPRVPTPGSRDYVAPEAKDLALDDRADVFALGTIAYQALAGILPTANAAGGPVPLKHRCPHAPDELCALVDQMVARDRFDRPTAAQVWSELGWAGAVRAVDPDRDLAGTGPAVDVVDVELRDIDGEATDPAAAPSAAVLRIRRPRWTPFEKLGAEDAGELGVVSGEIRVRRS